MEPKIQYEAFSTRNAQITRN